MTAEQNRLLIQRPMRPTSSGERNIVRQRTSVRQRNIVRERIVRERNIFRVRNGKLADATGVADNPKPDAATRPGRVTSAGTGEN